MQFSCQHLRYCTRCGATMVKGIEKYGIPVVHLCTVVPISRTIGANRIYPVWYFIHWRSTEVKKSYKIREKLVRRAFKALQTPIKSRLFLKKMV